MMLAQPFLMKTAGALGGLVLVLMLQLTSGAIAAPQRLDCSLTQIKTKAGESLDTKPEKRSITVVLDQDAAAITVYQNGSAQALDNVTFEQSSIDGYVKQMSLGIDRLTLYVVAQTYKPDSTISETGTCSPSTQPPP